VQREPAHEFQRVQGHLLEPATVGVAFPGEANPIVLEFYQAVIAQGDQLRVPSQVFEHLFRLAKRRH
jgi:hypothetical protein